MNNAPIREPAGEQWSKSWAAWFQSVASAIGWRKAFNFTFVENFGNVLANSQSAAVTKTIPDAQIGDAVIVTPLDETPGLIYKGVVTAVDTVSLYACNFTAAPINPNSTTFRIVVLQN